MLGFSAKTRGMREIERTLRHELPIALTKCREKANKRSELLGVAESRKRCPISPKKEQHVTTLKRKKTSTRTDLTPGGLTRSIRGESDADHAEIFVPSNSEGAKYAEKIHDGDYKLGVGSRRKAAATGEKVGKNFIVRAIKDKKEAFQKIYEDELTKTVQGV